MPLKPSRQRFAAEYVKDCNATQAAIRAGYSANTAYSQGQRLLKVVEVMAEITKLQSKALNEAGLKATDVMRAIEHVVNGDVRRLFDEQGNLRPIHALTREQAALIGGFEIIKKNAEAGDGHIDTVHKVKLKDTARYVEMGAKHFALLTEVVKHTADDELLALLQRRQAKAKANG
jgi:phage terminase small subunit